MTDFELVLDDCLNRLTSGAATLDECLRRYPDQAAQLRPLLQTALRFDVARDVRPSSAFRARARGQLTNYMKAHPHRRPRVASSVWRAVVSLAVLVMAFLITGTAFAQSALPGQALYAWKLSSERVWRAVAPDRTAVDVTLADRRADEMAAVAADPAREAQARQGYLEVLARLKSESDPQRSAPILKALKSQQAKFSAAGISVPELDHYLEPFDLAPSTPAPVLPGIAPTVLPETKPTPPVPHP